MSRLGNISPAKREIGIDRIHGAGSGKPVQASAARTEPVSPLTNVFPGEEVRHAYFSSIDWAALTIPAGQAAWFILRRIRVGPGLDFQQCALTGVRVDALPCNPDGNDVYSLGGTIKQWGDTRSGSAAIVIARNLPGNEQTWYIDAPWFPGINVAAGSPSILVPPRGAANYIHTARFAPGKINDTNPSRLVGTVRYLPDVHRFTEDNLDIALVCTPATTAVAGKVLGEAMVSVYLQPFRQPIDYRNY